jgi:hypothetical protein
MMRSSISLVLLVAVGMTALHGCGGDEPTPTNPDPNPGTTNIAVHSGVKLSAQANTIYGNLYDADSDTSYRIQFYGTRRSEIEFLYYYDPDSSAFILASPNATQLKTVGNYFAYISSQDGAHASNLKTLTGVTAAQFDALKDSTALKTMVAGGGTAGSNVVTIAANSVVSFTTSAGKAGVLKVVEFNGNQAASSMTIDVKTLR